MSSKEHLVVLTFIDDDLLCLVTNQSVILFNSHQSFNSIIVKVIILASNINSALRIQM